MCHTIASKSCFPATAALENLEKALEVTAASVMNKERPLISLKRPRSSLLGSFDLSFLVEASQPVEDSMAFPSIEWSNDIDSVDDAEFIAPLAVKRRCRGLVRSDFIKCSLSKLGSSSRKKESYSSLC